MAEIPVERKKRAGGAAVPMAASARRGLPWWLFPLVALLLLIPLLLLLARGCDGNNAGLVGNANNANRDSVTGNAANVGNSRTTANAAAVVTDDNDNSVVRSTANVNSSSNNDNGDNRSADSGATITDTSYFAGVNDKQTLVGRTAEFGEARVRRVISDHVFTVRSGRREMFVLLDEALDSGGGNEEKVKIRPGQRLDLTGEFREVPTEETNAEREKDLKARDFKRMKNQKVYLHATSVKNS